MNTLVLTQQLSHLCSEDGRTFCLFFPQLFSKAVKLSFHMPVLAYRYLIQTKASAFLCLSYILQPEPHITEITGRDGNTLIHNTNYSLGFFFVHQVANLVLPESISVRCQGWAVMRFKTASLGQVLHGLMWSLTPASRLPVAIILC